MNKIIFANIFLKMIIIVYIFMFLAFVTFICNNIFKSDKQNNITEYESTQESIKTVEKYDTIINDQNVLFLKKSDNDWILKYRGTINE